MILIKLREHLFKSVIFIVTFFTFTCGVAHASSASPVRYFAAGCDPAAGSGGLSSALFTPWYKYLPGEEDDKGVCRVHLGNNIDIPKTATLILVAVIELLTRVASLIALGYLIWGSIQYITSQGEAQSLSNAKTTIANSLIGLAITLLAIALIQFLARAFT